MNPLKDVMKRGPPYQKLGQLNRHIASMLDDLGADLD